MDDDLFFISNKKMYTKSKIYYKRTSPRQEEPVGMKNNDSLDKVNNSNPTQNVSTKNLVKKGNESQYCLSSKRRRRILWLVKCSAKIHFGIGW